MQNYSIKIGQACKEANITPNTLKRWEKEYKEVIGDVMPIPRNPNNNHRVFNLDWIKWLNSVREALEGGKDWQYIWYEVPSPDRVIRRAPVSYGPVY